MTFVASVLIPTLNEADDIEACLACVAAQTVGPERLEVLLVDGGSVDGTVELAQRAAAGAGFGSFAVVPNPVRRTAAGLHRALGAATTPVVVRVDARSRVGPDHVRLATATLEERPDVGVVGGSQVALDRGTGVVAAGIARALTNRWTTGLARYRRSAVAGPADTVWLGAFRTEELRAVGGWDPDHGINEDFELNRRYRASGSTVWFEPAMAAGYMPRGDLGALARQYHAFGRSKGLLWATGARPAPRQLASLAAPVIAGVGGLLVARKVGPGRSMAMMVVGLFVLDHVGTRASAGPAVRAASVAASVTFMSAWWSGAVAGAVGRR